MVRDYYREHLRAVVGSSAAPFGYTLTIWTTGAILTNVRGTPTAVDALVFMLGAVVGFACAASLAFGLSFRNYRELPAAHPRRPALWGSLNFVSVGVSIGAATLVSHMVPSLLAWPLASFLCTLVYLLVLSAQFSVVDWRTGQGEEET